MLQIQSVPPIPLFHASDVPSYSKARQHPSTYSSASEDDDDMDIDNDHNTAGPSSSTRKSIATPGSFVTSSKDYMRGHGTYIEAEDVLSTVAGTIERVNKLVSVRAARQRYNPEKGDLVVGRVVEVGSSRWKVDINGRQDAVLQLSSVNLPGGVQV